MFSGSASPAPASGWSDEADGPQWYRSLYWRAAFALITLVALLLVAEGALFLWFTAGKAGAMPRDPRQMAQLIASDIEASVARDQALDLTRHVADQYGHYFQTIIVVMRDGRLAANHDDVEPDMLELARSTLDRPRRRGFGRGGIPPEFRGLDDGLDGRRDGDRGDPFRDRRGPPLTETASIVLGDTVAGRVVVLTGAPPFSRIVDVVGPTMWVVAGGVLVVGGAAIALVVFGPPRRRLAQVQDATERLGGGDLSARAPEHGGDEIAALARSFNRMADELTRRAQAVEASDRVRRQLLADVSHELMTPLTAMRGYIETLGMAELQLDSPTRERYMRIVGEETTRLEKIIGDLLDLARLEGGGTTIRRQRVETPVLFNRVAERHEREMQARRITFDTRIAEEAQQLTGDADRLEQALQNLVANALRYTPDDGRIELAAERRGDRTILAVRDSGPGVPVDQLDQIFDRFYKTDASRRSAGGSGLGLSIAKAIIGRHGGTILVRNDNGAVFEISLP
jgi:two-component system OmpR family sensor kinase